MASLSSFQQNQPCPSRPLQRWGICGCFNRRGSGGNGTGRPAASETSLPMRQPE